MTKEKRILKDFSALWNCQTIEVRGKIYLTGGSKANTKDYLKSTYVLNENATPKWEFFPLENMHYARDAHGIISWRSKYIIVVGSWHSISEEACSKKKCEIYSIEKDTWSLLPDLHYDSCAPGLVIMEDRYLYKIGGAVNIRKVEMLDLHNPEYWIDINTTNQIGKKNSINRCLAYPLSKEEPLILVLGCHFMRAETPFTYHLDKNKFKKFTKSDIAVDMYRSNDIVQTNKNYIYIRPFVKVGEPAEHVKIYKYWIED